MLPFGGVSPNLVAFFPERTREHSHLENHRSRQGRLSCPCAGSWFGYLGRGVCHPEHPMLSSPCRALWCSASLSSSCHCAVHPGVVSALLLRRMRFCVVHCFGPAFVIFFLLVSSVDCSFSVMGVQKENWNLVCVCFSRRRQ